MTDYPNLQAAVDGDAHRMRFASPNELSYPPDEKMFGGYTERELRLGFAAVMHDQNWKYPIDSVFNKITPEEIEVCHAAIGFYAGGDSEDLHYPDGSVRIVAPGYYAVIGA